MGVSRFIFCVFIVLLPIIISWICLVKRYKRCPPGKLMVIRGHIGPDMDGNPRSSICITQGAKFVIPILQEVHYIDLSPIVINIDLYNLTARDNSSVAVRATAFVAVSTKDGVMQNAVDRVMNKDISEIESLAQEIVNAQVRLCITQLDANDLNDRDQFIKTLTSNIDEELKNLGLTILNLNLVEVSCKKQS